MALVCFLLKYCLLTQFVEGLQKAESTLPHSAHYNLALGCRLSKFGDRPSWEGLGEEYQKGSLTALLHPAKVMVTC